MDKGICKKHLIFLGPPGCGKGTQAKLLSEKMGFLHFSTGEILRESIKSGTDLGKKVKGIVESGHLVNDETMKSIISEKFNSLQGEEKFILDGYPRTVVQGEDLEEISRSTEIEIDRVLYFTVPDEEIVKRISSRRMCPECGKIHNLLAMNETENPVCSSCSTPLEQREDDKPEAVKKRLKVYKKKTKPLVNFYKERKKLTEINGNDKIDNIFASIKEEVLCL